jgi:hypothetical protein
MATNTHFTVFAAESAFGAAIYAPKTAAHANIKIELAVRKLYKRFQLIESV